MNSHILFYGSKSDYCETKFSEVYGVISPKACGETLYVEVLFSKPSKEPQSQLTAECSHHARKGNSAPL